MADDIRDFEIEGMSIGDSLLDFYSKDEIIKQHNAPGSAVSYTDNSFLYASFPLNKKNYDKISFHYKKNDNRFIIYHMSGILRFDDNFNQCENKQNEIVKSILPLLKNFKKENFYVSKDMTNGERKIVGIHFSNKNNEYIRIDCTDWSAELKFTDHLRLDFLSSEFNFWLNTEAYK